MMEPSKPFYDHSQNGPQYSSSPATPYNPPQYVEPQSADGANQANAQGAPQQEDTSGYRGIHPIAAVFHILFKVGALLVYLLGNLLGLGPFVVMFVICVLCHAFDFWVSKNVTGRLLVSMRWWSRTKDDGNTEWIFESAPENSDRVSPYDRTFFWVTTVGFTVTWLVLMIFSILNWKWLPLAIIGFLLTGANTLGYYKCSRDAKKHLTQFMISQAAQRPDLVQGAASAALSASKK